MNDLVQAGFFGIDTTKNKTTIPDWNSLSKPELLKEAVTYHNTLEQQEQQLNTIIQFANEQKRNVIADKGELYQYMKSKMTYDEWVNWLKDIRVAISTAYEYIKLATEYYLELTSTVGRTISRYQLRAIHHSGEGHQILAKLEDGKIKPEDINTEIEAAKKRIKEAEEEKEKAQEEKKLAQHQLFTTQTQSQEDKDKLNQQIEELTKKIENLSKPDEIIKEVDKPETKAQIEQLEAEKKELIQQRDSFKKLADELSTELDGQEEKREQEARDLKIRQDWQKLTDAMYKSVVKFLGQLPTPIDMQVFETDDWARLDQLVEVFRRGANECNQLHSRPNPMIIDAK